MLDAARRSLAEEVARRSMPSAVDRVERTGLLTSTERPLAVLERLDPGVAAKWRARIVVVHIARATLPSRRGSFVESRAELAAARDAVESLAAADDYEPAQDFAAELGHVIGVADQAEIGLRQLEDAIDDLRDRTTAFRLRTDRYVSEARIELKKVTAACARAHRAAAASAADEADRERFDFWMRWELRPGARTWHSIRTRPDVQVPASAEGSQAHRDSYADLSGEPWSQAADPRAGDESTWETEALEEGIRRELPDEFLDPEEVSEKYRRAYWENRLEQERQRSEDDRFSDL